MHISRKQKNKNKKQLNRHVQSGLSLCIKVHNGGGLVAAPGELLRLLGQLNKWPNPQKGPLIVPTVLQGLIPTVFFLTLYTC